MELPWLDKILPCDADFEFGFAVRLYREPMLMHYVRSHIESRHIHTPLVRRLYGALASLWDEGEAINRQSIGERLLRSGIEPNEVESMLRTLDTHAAKEGITGMDLIHVDASYIRGFAVARSLVHAGMAIVSQAADDVTLEDLMIRDALKLILEIQADNLAQEAAIARARELKTMPYSDYLATKEWWNRRNLQVRRDGGACRVCGSTESLNVHHRTYERRGNEGPGDLITLCQPCHYLFHDNGKLAKAPE